MRTSPAAILALVLSAGHAAAAPVSPPELANIPVALLVDAGSGRTLFARQPAKRFSPASTAKVMTAYVAFQEMAARRLAPGRIFTVADATARTWNGRGSSLYLQSGAILDADTLLHGIATVSANDASVVLAEGHSGDIGRWCALMNAQAHALGMADSHFATPNGWPDGGATYVSAQDLAKLGDALIANHPALYRRYFGRTSMTWGGVTQRSRNPILGTVRGADGIKTGHTNEAGYNFLGSAERGGRRLIMVVAGARSEEERAAASRALIEWGFAGWQSRPLFAAGARVGEARVQEGDARRVPLVAGRAVHALLPKGRRAPISLKVRYFGPLAAPIAKGTQVADLEIAVAGEPTSRLPLFAGASVAKAGPFDRLVNGLAGLFS